MAGLPGGVEGTAAGILLYSAVCLLASCVMIWLSYHHRERTSYISFLSYFTALSTLCSIIQQIHSIISWREIIEAQFVYMRANAGSPELIISNSAVGLDLVLYYIQFYCYNVESMFVMFWGWELVQSVYQLTNKPKLQYPLKVLNRTGLPFSICFPLITVCSLQAPPVRSNTAVFMLLAGQPLFWSIGLGSVALLLVFGRYIYSQHKCKRFTLNVNASNLSRGTESSHKKRTMYDRWLVIRFTIAFVVVSAFEMTIVLFSLTSEDRLKAQIERQTPDLSVETAQSTFLFFIPGVTPSLLLFVIFASTKPCIEHMKKCLFRQRREPMRQTPTISSPMSPSDSTRSYEIFKPRNSYQSLPRYDERQYGSPRTETLEMRIMKPLPPTPETSEFLGSENANNEFISRPRLERPRKLYIPSKVLDIQ